MKKFFTFLVVAGTLVACSDNSGTGNTDVKESVLNTLDSAGAAKIASLEDSIERRKEAVEATFEKTDSANKALADSTKKIKPLL